MRGSKKPNNQKRGRETARPSDRWPSATARPLQPQRSCDECAFAGQPFARAQAAFLVNGTYLFKSDAASISAFGAITTIYICLTLTPPSLTVATSVVQPLPIVASLANLAIMVNSSSSTTWLILSLKCALSYGFLFIFLTRIIILLPLHVTTLPLPLHRKRPTSTPASPHAAKEGLQLEGSTRPSAAPTHPTAQQIAQRTSHGALEGSPPDSSSQIARDRKVDIDRTVHSLPPSPRSRWPQRWWTAASQTEEPQPQANRGVPAPSETVHMASPSPPPTRRPSLPSCDNAPPARRVESGQPRSLLRSSQRTQQSHLRVEDPYICRMENNKPIR